MPFSNVVMLALTIGWVENDVLAFTLRVAYGTAIDPEMYPYVVEVKIKNYCKCLSSFLIDLVGESKILG